jgi:16S rRNA (uracil1498-N3)-methyltransferase
LPHFFVSSKDIQGKKALITGPLAHHLKGPLRMKSGERIHLVDEKMRGYHVVLDGIGRNEISGEVIGEDEGRVSDTAVILAQAIIKGKRMDLIVQKATELGIMEIIPIITERSVVRPTTSGGIKDMRRWQIIAEEASRENSQFIYRLSMERCRAHINHMQAILYMGEGAGVDVAEALRQMMHVLDIELSHNLENMA